MKILLTTLLVALLTSCASDQQKPLVADSGYATLPLEGCNTDLRYLNQVLGWQGVWPSQWQAIISSGADSVDQKSKYWVSASSALISAKEKLRLGVKMKETVPRAVALRVHQQVLDVIAELSSENSKYTFNNSDHENASAWNALIRERIAPAVVDFEHFLRNEYLPNTQISPGLNLTRDGSSCFFDAVTWWTGLSPTVDQIEAIGWRYITDTRAELVKTGRDGETLTEILNRLRASVANEHTTEEELIRVSVSALDRAHKNTQLAFSKQSDQNIIVTKLPLHMRAAFPAGRYAGPLEGSTDARYIINPSRPNERRLMAEVIAFHEGIPGHHLWATYPRDTTASEYPSGLSGTTEGWAIYAEYVADEMGLFSSTFDRQGMMAKHLWAASRLIVEPGIHLRGWSREKAINFMLENTVMSRTEIEIEVDRYIAMPGQSLSYILGADLILTERERSMKLMGTDFDIKAFHDVVLGAGARPLPVVREDIRQWGQMGTKGRKAL